jgi:ankyrin repeat domain-containing protein 17
VPVVDLDSETDSNHDTALTLACAGGHEELVSLLLSRGADNEHRLAIASYQTQSKL